MDGGEYNSKTKEATVKIDAEGVTKDPNGVFMEKRAALIKNGVWLDNKKPRIYNFAPNTPCIFGRVEYHKEQSTTNHKTNNQ